MNIWGREVADRRTAGIFYVAVVQAMLLFSSETRVLNRQLDNSLEGFHHWAVRRVVGMGPRCQRGGIWVYPSIGAYLEMVGLDDISGK